VISSLPSPASAEVADDATVEIPMPQRVLRKVGSGWGLIQGHREGRSLIPKRSLRQLVEGLVALAILAALSPVLLVVALAVKWTSEGPMLFRQERLGLHRSTFKIIKFRTMSNKNSDAQHREFVKKMLTSDDDVDGGEQGVYKLVNDPRITPIGGFQRRTSIDELPQLWNVVRGEMSLVGPRPVLAWEADLFPPEAERRFACRPGMTGLWQVSGRSTLDFKAALELDVTYVEKKSVWYDISILWRTVGVVFNRSVAR
jgi:lipopolysaccharide/colanic/teichoic acid biosynthesis glycosyltransferase